MTPLSDNEDLSNGWDALADEFIFNRSSTVGAAIIGRWSESFISGQSILDVACGFGGPYTQNFFDKGLLVHGVDASRTLLREYCRRFPGAIARCEAAEASSFFDKQFDGILSVGLIFLLSADAQVLVLENMASALLDGGRLLFTAPHQVCDWDDLLTGRKSRSLGREVYVNILQQHGLSLIDEYTDEGQSHYYDFQKEIVV